MFEGIGNGISLVKESFKVFVRHPAFIIPLIISWLIYAPTILYLKFWLPWNSLSLPQSLIVAFIIIFLFAGILSFSCTILLELIMQLEVTGKLDIDKALGKRFGKDIINILPIVLIWTIIWFILLIIEAMLSKSKDKNNDKLTTENAAKTLAGYNNISLSIGFIRAIEKGVRMIVFLILPAIVWEKLNFVQAIKKGIAVFKAHFSEFATGFVLTGSAQFILYLPPAIVFEIVDKYNITLSDLTWYFLFIYIAFAWSYSMYLEQMFSAQLYLWHLKWQDEVNVAKAKNTALPSLKSIEKPSILDDSHYLKERLNTK